MKISRPRRFHVRLVLALACPVVALSAETTSPSIEERLTRLEGALARIEARLSDTVSSEELAPALKEYSELTRALGWDGKSPLPAVRPGAREKSLVLGGYIQANFESGESPDSRFDGINSRFILRRARMGASGKFAEDFSFKLEADFGSNTIGTKTGAAGQLTDTYVAWTKLPAASLRLGQFKTPFGYEQLMADTKTPTAERSLPNDKLTLGRQVGAMLYGDLAEKRASYSLAAFNGTGVNTSTNDNQKFLWIGRVNGVLLSTKAGTQAVRLTAGVNYFTTEDQGSFTGRREGSGVDAQLAVGPASLEAEWLRNDRHPRTGAATTASGWSLLGLCSFNPQWEGALRYETYDSNTHTGNTTTDLWTYGLNYRIKGDDLKLSLNYLSGQPPAPAPSGDRFIGRMQIMF